MGRAVDFSTKEGTSCLAIWAKPVSLRTRSTALARAAGWWNERGLDKCRRCFIISKVWDELPPKGQLVWQVHPLQERVSLLPTPYLSSIGLCYSCFVHISVQHSSLWYLSKQAERRHLLLPDKPSSAWDCHTALTATLQEQWSAWSKTPGCKK